MKNNDQVPVVVYKKPQKKVKKVQQSSKNDDFRRNDRPNVKQFKLDVYRLLARSASASTSGVESSAKHSLAIALGAEPPKRKSVNYKQLQADLKVRRQQEKEQTILRKVSDTKLKSKGKEKPVGKRRKGGEKGETLSGFGSFRGGVLRLSKDDVNRIKTTKSLKLSQ